MINRKLPFEFAKLLVGVDAETTLDNVKKLEAKFNESVQSTVEAKFKENGRTPRIRYEDKRVFTKEQIRTMSPDEKNANWETVKKYL